MSRKVRPAWDLEELHVLTNIYPERGVDYCLPLLPRRTRRGVFKAAADRKIRSKVRDQLSRATRQKNDSRRTVASEATAASIAGLTYIRAHDPEARRVRLDLGADKIARITTQRHGAAMLLVLPDTVGIYERGCAADQIAADVSVHRKRGAA